MKTSMALKLGVLAIAALGLLSGCFLVQNTATIRFENNAGPEALNCFVDGEAIGTVIPGSWIFSEYTWTGASSTWVSWEAYRVSDSSLYAFNTELVQDGETTTIIF